MASFLLHMIAQKLRPRSDESIHDWLGHPSQWAHQYNNILATDPSSTFSPHWQHQQQVLLQNARDFLNGRGVWDVAGGSGHVSMAISLLGVRSTVIDPQDTVGQLPRRDRQLYHRAIQNHPTCQDPPGIVKEGFAVDGSVDYCQPVDSSVRIIPFRVWQAWFGSPPDGVDTSHSEPIVPVVDEHATRCGSALVALHPDEATDAIVDAAVRGRIPMVIVPCCVLSRRFVHRRKPNGGPVCTYEDLLEYLMAKDPTIQRTTLPFPGANTILWSNFDGDGTVS